jgi:hypothetical protein
MQQENSTQKDAGCLKAPLFHVLLIVFLCGIWYAFIGLKGILVGIASYAVTRFAIFFNNVFNRDRAKHDSHTGGNRD